MADVLITGGAGFIGSWTADLLLAKGYRVRILDSLQPRVHPKGKPAWVPVEAEFIQGDVADKTALSRALEGIQYVFHLAAYQDHMPDFSSFIHTNTESSALIFELAVENPEQYPLRKVIFASSQAVSGEGRYLCPSCAAERGYTLNIIRSDQSGRVHHYCLPPQVEVLVIPQSRSTVQLRQGDWEVHCPKCGGELMPVLIGEDTISPNTTYGISKYAIELLADRLGRRYRIPTVCMRYSCVQGPRNSFYNAYSGIARCFALRIMQGLPPLIFEDGGQLRDYVNVRDVARANQLVMEDERADFGTFNVGGGQAVTVCEFARMMAKAFNSSVEPDIPGEFRPGDTRHTISDNTRLEALGWQAQFSVEHNVGEYVEWIKDQSGTQEYLQAAELLMRQQGVILKANF